MNSNSSAFKVEPKPISKHLVVPTSKSQANRCLIMASLIEGEVVVENLPESEDVIWMKKALSEIGIRFKEEKNYVVVLNSFPECEAETNSQKITVHCGEGGTTTRFLAAMLARGSKTYVLDPEGPMRNRPMEDLVEKMKELGVEVTMGKSEWMTIKGPFNSKKDSIDISCQKSTQFASAMAMALYDKKIKVNPTDLNYSKDYWEMTLDIIKRKKKKHYRIPVDFSSLSYPIALAFITGECWVDNCIDRDIFQADAALVDYLSELGAIVRWTNKALYIGKVAGFSGKEYDCKDHPDLVPTLAYIASHAEGVSTFKNVSILKYKESDRIHEVQKILAHYKVKNNYDESNDIWTIEGGVHCKDAWEYNPPRDHRMVMTAYLFMRTHGGGTITNGDYVKKSFPDFFEQMQ